VTLRDHIVAAAERYEMPAYPRIDLVAARGAGARVTDLDGTEYLDLYGGHAVAILGHAPPRVADAIAMQARDLLFYSNVVHCPARARAAERLCRLAPWEDAQAFFVNSGAEANETALKIARKATGRTKVVAFQGGFHGRTLGALSVCGMKYRAMAEGLVGGVEFAEFNTADAIDEETAAVIVEPIQSMGGMRVLENADELRARCDAVGALLIFDEVQTAPARCGAWFTAGADICTTAKAVAAGFPAGVVLASGKVAETVEAGDQGTTFGGGPLACAAIDATLAELEELDGPARALAVEAQVREGLPGVEVLGRGCLLGIRVPGPAVTRTLRDEHRVLVGGCPGDATIIRIFPPINIDADGLARGLDAIRSVLA
jgi:acetylornithine aminotransferase/acetylornithine/N-succinyldiaminopimelate aminotransferase